MQIQQFFAKLIATAVAFLAIFGVHPRIPSGRSAISSSSSKLAGNSINRNFHFENWDFVIGHSGPKAVLYVRVVQPWDARSTIQFYKPFAEKGVFQLSIRPLSGVVGYSGYQPPSVWDVGNEMMLGYLTCTKLISPSQSYAYTQGLIASWFLPKNRGMSFQDNEALKSWLQSNLPSSVGQNKVKQCILQGNYKTTATAEASFIQVNHVRNDSLVFPELGKTIQATPYSEQDAVRALESNGIDISKYGFKAPDTQTEIRTLLK
jgi:hypothetical protein